MRQLTVRYELHGLRRTSAAYATPFRLFQEEIDALIGFLHKPPGRKSLFRTIGYPGFAASIGMMKILVPKPHKLITAVLLALGLSACSPPPAKFKATDITGSAIASGFDLPDNMGGGFELPDHNGKPRRFNEFRGKLVIVTFGFTNCPDVCPTTLLTLAQTMKQLGPDASAVQVIMITVDPARDTQQVMSEYVPSFDPRFIGLVPSEDALKQVAAQFKLVYIRNKPGKEGFYTIDHTAAAYVFDRRGQARLYVPHEMSVDDRIGDIRTLLTAPK